MRKLTRRAVVANRPRAEQANDAGGAIGAAANARGRSAHAPGATVFIFSPADGATVSSPVRR